MARNENEMVIWFFCHTFLEERPLGDYMYSGHPSFDEWESGGHPILMLSFFVGTKNQWPLNSLSIPLLMTTNQMVAWFLSCPFFEEQASNNHLILLSLFWKMGIG